jgi:hypothetical protein
MKKLVAVQELDGKGLEALLGQQVTLFCLNYTYTGKLVGVNAADIILECASIVYETGDFATCRKGIWKDAQKLSDGEWRIRTAAIESYGVFS